MSYDVKSVGHSDGEFDKKLRIVSKDKVALRAFEVCVERIVGGIFMLEKYDINTRMNKYEMTDIGTNAAKQTGLKVGDIVCADQLARYYDTFPVSVIKYDSIIFKTDKDETFIEPLKGMVFVSMDKLEEDVQGGVLVLTDLLPVGTITHINVDGINMCDLKVGDKVLLSNDCDNVIYRGKKILIYKYENILATVEK